ncbi:MAG: 30S ribosomal protein S2 [Gemmatimonadota bacterium]|nr:30S ribosomal protein S2 [Gemmatimonadota bacterium]
MAFPTVQDLLEAGVHFGHQTRRWNPKMKKFIFAERNGIHIIDLKKTLDHLKKASDKVRDIVQKGGTILFVGTKKQMRDVIRDEAERCEMFYVNERWLGGMITNFQTIKKNIRRLKELERMRDEGEFELRTKKEGLSLQRELLKLKKILDGIKMLNDIPAAMYVIDAQKEKIAVSEANKLGIPLIALIDTNADPEEISYPVAGNDDAIRSVKLITQTIADSVLEGRALIVEKPTDVKEKMAPFAREKAGEAGQDKEKARDKFRHQRPRRRPRKKKPGEEASSSSTSAPASGK